MTAQINPAILNALLQALAPILADNGKARKPRSDKGFTKQLVQAAETTDQRKAAFAAAVVAAFSKAGFGNVTPNVDVLTFAKWEAKGFKPKTGTHAIRVKTRGMNGKGIPLFHSSQVEPITETVA